VLNRYEQDSFHHVNKLISCFNHSRKTFELKVKYENVIY
jgi:hypothetical protein